MDSATTWLESGFFAPHSVEQPFGKARNRRALDAAIQSMIAAAGTRKAGLQGF